jgi:hypothetical protein
VLTYNDTTSPEGITNAMKMTSGGVYATFPTAANTDYVFSVFAKTNTATSIEINYVDQNSPYRGGTIRYTFATDTAVVTLQSENNSVTADREDYGNGWIRVMIKFKTNVAKNYNYQQIGFTGGDGWIYGAQYEAGSYATSYIPTYGTSVTRNGELSTQVENFTDLPTSYPFAIYSEPYLTNAIGNGAWAFYENSHQYSYYSLRITSQGKFNMLSRPQGVTQNEVNSTSTYSEGFHKVLCVYENETTIKIYVNGALEGTNSNCTNNSFKSDANDFLLGMFRGIDTSPCSIKQFMVFNNSLTDQEAIDLTTI